MAGYLSPPCKARTGASFCRVDGVLEEMKPLQSYFQKHENAIRHPSLQASASLAPFA